MSAEIIPANTQAVERREPTLLDIIREVASRPGLEHVEALERLLAMKERAEDREAKRLFADALTELQAEMPPINKHGEILVKGKLRSKYALIEDIDDVLRPLMAKYGFSFALSQDAIKDKMRDFVGTLIHRGGHRESLRVSLPLDASEFRSAVQSEGSTISYARRQLYKAHFNIVERGVDDDGNGGEGILAISDDDAKNLQAKLEEVKADLPRFLKYFEIERLGELKKADLSRAYEMIESKAKK